MSRIFFLSSTVGRLGNVLWLRRLGKDGPSLIENEDDFSVLKLSRLHQNTSFFPTVNLHPSTPLVIFRSFLIKVLQYDPHT
jgi:hypothetical protein